MSGNLINWFQNKTSTGYHYNSNSSLNINNGRFSTSGSIWNDVLSMALGVGTMVASNAMNKSASASQAGQGQGASVTAFQDAMTKYVKADAALDTANKNMRTALDSLKDMQSQLNKINNGEAKTLLNAANERKNNNVKPEGYDEYVKDQAVYERVSSAYQQYSQLKGEVDVLTNQAKSVKDSNSKAIDVNGNTATAKIIADEITYTDSDGKDKTLTLKGDGNDSELVNNTIFYIMNNKTGKSVEDPAAKNAALMKAKAIDEQYNQREAIAKQYNDIQAQITGKKNNMTVLDNANPEVDFSNPNAINAVDSLKPSQKGVSNGYKADSCQKYKDADAAIQADIDKYTKMNSNEYKTELEKKIAAKKEEIKTKLKPAIEAAQSEFNTKKAAIDAMQQEIQDISTKESDLEEAKTASKTAKSNKRHGIFNFLNPKNWGTSAQTKYYKQQRRNVKAAQSNFAQAYGTDHVNASALIQNAQTIVNKENFIVDPSEYNNL